METHDIISTPEITGNIGSCTTRTERIIVKSKVFSENGHTLATNSCTGNVERFDYSSISIIPAMIGIVCITIVLYAIFKKPDNITQY